MARKNFIAFACGRKGSGKSYLLRRYLNAFPRVLTLDAVGERADESENAVVTYTVAQTLDALEAVARLPKWHIVAVVDPSDCIPLFSALAPVGMYPNGGYSRAVGGVCVECPEVDILAPNSTAMSPIVRNAWQRGRHYRLSLISGTQRPHHVNRVVTSQSDVVIAFAQHEPRDLRYLSDVMGSGIARVIPALPKYSHVRYLPDTGIGQIVDAAGRIIRTLREDGQEVQEVFL